MFHLLIQLSFTVSRDEILCNSIEYTHTVRPNDFFVVVLKLCIILFGIHDTYFVTLYKGQIF